MSITRHHNEWLSLVPSSGPFLSLPVLTQAFPQGLDAHDADHARRLRMAFDEWDDNYLSKRPDPGIHRAWTKFVLAETLGYEELLAEGQTIPQTLKSDIAEYGETLRPDFVVNDPATKKARLLVQVYPKLQSLTKPVASSRWKTSPDTRMMQLLHDTGIRLGIVTNGDHWMLVNAPKNETTGYVTWHANLWLEEPVTLRAFRSVLGVDRLFSVPENETLEALLDKSAADQQEVTDQLGYQVRKAVEVLIQAIDKADQDHGRKLLADVNEKLLYESALTIMMRLVFLFCAEERELLLLGDDLYDKNYAVSTLREQLEVARSEHSDDILNLRYDAWTRLLSSFRAVYAGAKHDQLELPAYGGSLFNPDRFPFLEGRKFGTNWKTTEATPLPVSNRTVLHLLEALQVLQTKVGNTTEARKISFRALDIEQIGHVYEGLLDHTAKRATEPVLGLAGTRDKEPEIALAELEKIAAKGEKELLKVLKDETGRSESALKKALNAEIDDQLASRFRTACQDSDLWQRVKPFAGLVRLDTVDYPVVITTGSIFVTAGTDRRSSGTHYTPKTLTEPIVQYTMEPLVYIGPADGLTKEQWKLRPARELLALKICDMACGSGAFLVQACRYMAARLLEAWDAVQRANPGTVHITPEGEASTGKPGEMLIPADSDERQTYALRIVAQRCLYGVDKNPLAVEMAKLSLWLLTLAKNLPFEFLEHAIRHGDSLVGIHHLDQLRKFNIDGKGEDNGLFLQFLDSRIKTAIALRRQIAEMQANTIEDVEAQDRMLRETNENIDRLKCAADMLISAEFAPGSAADRRAARDDAAITVTVNFHDSDLPTFRCEAQKALLGQVTFHWPLEFPEVVVERGGFDAFLGNPPFMAGTSISTVSGKIYASYLKEVTTDAGNRADLAVYFLRRAFFLVRLRGNVGFVATNSIAEADSRQGSFSYLLREGGAVYWAVPNFKWPGSASLTVSTFAITKGDWSGTCLLNGKPVKAITSFLDSGDEVTEPSLLMQPIQGFTGSKVYGDEFIISRLEGYSILTRNREATKVVRPYWDGDQFNESPTLDTERFIVNFFDMSEDEARAFPEPFDLVEMRVKPGRMNAPEQGMKDRWWQFQRIRKELYVTIEGLSKVLMRSIVSKHHVFGFVNPNATFSHAVVVIASEANSVFGLLQSSLHECWAAKYGSKHETRSRYTISDCFHTFPFPESFTTARNSNLLSEIDVASESYLEHRCKIMRDSRKGLTKTYNRYHTVNESTTEILKLRHLHVEMDNAVAAAYGWTDLDLGHDFHETKQGVRYTISEPARREVLARLLKLNHECYAEEVKQGLHEKTKAKPAPKAITKPVKVKAEPTLFDQDDATFPSTERDSYLCGLVCDLVKTEPGLPVSAYIDSLVTALGYQRHQRLLIGKDRTTFAKLCKASPLASWGSTDKIPWAELQNLLIRRKAIKLAGKTIQAESEWTAVRNSYPATAPELVALLRKAAGELRELQAQANPEIGVAPNEITPERAEIFQAFINDKSKWYGVAA